MKKVPILCILFYAASLTAGWKWEKVNIEVPFHPSTTAAAYDPVRQKIVILNLNDDAQSSDVYDTYLFDGQSFEKVCTRYPDSVSSCFLYSTSSLFWDTNLQKLVSCQLCSNPYSSYLNFYLLQEDSYYCWKTFSQGLSYDAGFDPIRKRAVFFSLNYNEIYEYDGTSIYTFSGFPYTFGDQGYITFDETTQKLIYFGWDTKPSVILYEWDGINLIAVNPSPPAGYDVSSYSPYSIAYHPALGGSVSPYGMKGALLYKNKKWEPLIQGNTPWGNLVIYYPPNGEMYFITYLDGVFVLRRSHERPFEKP
ncbi:MAG TPA: hypothetical protein PK014_07850 [Thermoanaerobaculia bacterium]|nr:hypothetical protein [Thermoanaerobaculia bacterium]HUM30020.1 hypothetical protein [Thermoanaerobaculia bacterium]HXK68291.1 hypothetical protein [Thermoanaerobaculia bacterium]